MKCIHGLSIEVGCQACGEQADCYEGQPKHARCQHCGHGLQRGTFCSQDCQLAAESDKHLEGKSFWE